MDIELLENYKKQRTLFQKMVISKLNTTLSEILDEQNALPLIKRSLYRLKYETFINDITKKIKDETTSLRTIKKTDPEDVIKQDIADIIASKNLVPDCKNPFEWTTKLRTRLSAFDCFSRTILFDKIDTPSLWDMELKEYEENSNIPQLEDMDIDEQENKMLHIVTNLLSSDNKYIEDPSEEFLDTISGQMSINLEQMSMNL